MKSVVISVLMLSMTLIFVSCENESQPIESTSDVTTQSLNKPWPVALEELGEKFTTAFANGDVDVVMSCFWNSPNTLLVLENGVVVQGWDNIYVGIEGLIAATEWRTLTVDEIISQFRIGDEVYTVGKATWHYQVIGGPEVQFQEVWTDVAKKVKGNWVYVVDHAHDLTPFTP